MRWRLGSWAWSVRLLLSASRAIHVSTASAQRGSETTRSRRRSWSDRGACEGARRPGGTLPRPRLLRRALSPLFDARPALQDTRGQRQPPARQSMLGRAPTSLAEWAEAKEDRESAAFEFAPSKVEAGVPGEAATVRSRKADEKFSINIEYRFSSLEHAQPLWLG